MRGLTVVTELLERTTAALLALTIVAGSVFLWIGIPVLGLWIAGQVTETTTSFLFAALGGVPLAMMATGWALFAVGARYERLRHGGYGTSPRRQSAWLVAQSGERATSRRSRMGSSLVEVCMAASATLAVVLLLVWFFFIAEMKLAPMQ